MATQDDKSRQEERNKAEIIAEQRKSDSENVRRKAELHQQELDNQRANRTTK